MYELKHFDPVSCSSLLLDDMKVVCAKQSKAKTAD